MNRIKQLFLRQSPSNWLIFLWDVALCASSFLLANALLKDGGKPLSASPALLSQMAVVAGTAGLCFLSLRTHCHLLRYSGLGGALRLVSALAISLLVLLPINAVFSSIGGPIIPLSLLLVYFFIASFLLTGYRLLVGKWFRTGQSTAPVINIVVYGSSYNGAQLKTTIEQGSNGLYAVVAFIDDDPALAGKMIDNTPVYALEEMESLCQRKKINMLLFAKEDIDRARKNEVTQYCLAHGINIKNVPPVTEWIKDRLNMAQLKEIRIEELLGRPPIDLKKTAAEAFLTNKRILITGAAGSIGSEIARQVAAIKPMLLILCDQNETGLHDLEYELKNSYPDCPTPVVYICDIRDSNAVENLFLRFKPGIVFHAAAYKHVPIMEFHPSEAVRNNVLGTKVLADLSIKYAVDCFLFISTDKAINPTNIMGASKRLAEIYVQALGNRSRKVVHVAGQANNNSNKIQISPAGATRFITTRFGNVLGSNGSVIARFKEQIASGGPVTVTDPEIIRYFMTISEACNLVLEAVTIGQGSEIFIFDMGEPVKILDLARKMISLSGLTPDKDIRIKFTGLRPGEKLYEELLNKKEQVKPTHHKKILIANVMEYDFYEINSRLDELIQKAQQSLDEEVVRQMKQILPEFRSKNSLYASLDDMNQGNLSASQ